MEPIEPKAVVIYPCQWLYKIIGTEQETLAAAVSQIFADTEYSLSFSRASRTGRYVALNLEATVYSEEARNFFFAALREHAAVKMVL